MPSLKQKTVSGITWSFIDNFSNVGVQFIVGIILARILSPKEFGLIGMITVFMSVSQAFIDFGFSNSLIRKKDCSQQDYSTVFYFNIIVSVVFYSLLFALAKPISVFYNEPRLINIIYIIGFTLIINSTNIIQRAILTKNINFKLQTKISIISSILSGILSIYLAFIGFGVWSLVWKAISASFLTSLLLWLWNGWLPKFIFDYKLFKEHFKYGYKLLISGLIDTLYKNVYFLIIGKFFSATELGYYTRSQQFSNLPSSNITAVINRVSFPVLSQLQDEPVKLKDGYKKIIKTTMFISFVLMMGMAAVAKPLVISLIGVKWISSILYLQLLCFSAMLYPLHSLNLNMLYVKGRSDLFLRLEIIKKLLAVPVILIAIFFGIKWMLISFIFNSLVAYFLNSYWSGKLVGYAVKEQIADIFPSFLIASLIGIVVFSLNYLLLLKPILLLCVQVLLGILLTIYISKLFKIEGYLEIKEIIITRFSIIKKYFYVKK